MTPVSALETLIACPHCDALYDVAIPPPGEKMRCDRCHTILIAPRRHAGIRIVLLSLASLALVLGAATQPFISIRRFGLSNDATLVDVALSFSGPLMVLALIVLSLVLVLPLVRAVLTLFVLAPLVMNRPPLPGAARAFCWSEALRPWSMAEIFALGSGVALIKIVDLAHVSLGPAFWMFAAMVVLIGIQNTLMCRWSVWRALET